MSKHRKTITIQETAYSILAAHNPMTVRQVYYQLVSRQVIENNRGQYQAVSNALVQARQEGFIPWEWIEDRTRRPRSVSMWDNLSDFGYTVLSSYRRDVWDSQPHYIEVWLEKDALSGIFEGVLEPYGVTLNVGRGYDGWDSIHNAAERFNDGDGMTILYFGDFDPSGEDMARSLKERLAFFKSSPEILKVALTYGDITRYNLPPDFTKVGDTRQKNFVAKYGNVAVELDALPIDILRDRIVREVEARMDLNALAGVKLIEDVEREELARALGR
ncbi:MAG: hypothetical protein KG012_09380 [Deltaproteobacteria bacterium]|nr:hypothetical protein [Deltaproteobacteria bacterium]